MIATTQIAICKTKSSKLSELNFEKLEFGKYVSDHMLVCDFIDGQWQQPQILPFANLLLSPTTLALHYGQTVFEGMKAFRMHDGRVNIFRIDRHYERFVKSLQRMCMAVLPKEIFVEGLLQLIQLDKNWVPPQTDAALYLRPFMIATEERFGVKVSANYRYVVFTGPVPTLYANPIKVRVETDFVRAAKGGTGFAKCGGNYGGAFYPTQLARAQGYEQVLWTDSRENKYIEESGMMNVMFVINDKLVTPPLSDTILDGITRDSLLTLAAHMGIAIEERRMSIQELEEAFRRNTITEAFGAGTAAVVAPINVINIHGVDYRLASYHAGNVMYRLKTKLENIRTGKEADVFGWNWVIREENNE